MAHLDANTLVGTMVDWYVAERASNVDLEEDGDMLLFQWGTEEWTPGTIRFEFDLTRQFIVVRRDEPAIFQLSWTALYEPDADTEALGSGDHWCGGPDEVNDFLSYVNGTDAAAFAQAAGPVRAQVHFQRV